MADTQLPSSRDSFCFLCKYRHADLQLLRNEAQLKFLYTILPNIGMKDRYEGIHIYKSNYRINQHISEGSLCRRKASVHHNNHKRLDRSVVESASVLDELVQSERRPPEGYHTMRLTESCGQQLTCQTQTRSC